MSEGWVSIHRQLKDHWLWKSERRLKWWIDILLTVNHSDSNVLIKGQLIECKRGQSVRSLETWAKDWNVSKGAVRDFFKLLKSDSMIELESLQITTRITVCLYDTYQKPLHAEETQRKRKPYPNNNDNNGNNNISVIFDQFRKLYPGTKRGLQTELNSFLKKNSVEIIPLLLPALEKEIAHRIKLQQANKFIPEWKHLSTWASKRSWEQEFTEEKQMSGTTNNSIQIKTPKEWTR